jgi:hypothetical protein
MPPTADQSRRHLVASLLDADAPRADAEVRALLCRWRDEYHEAQNEDLSRILLGEPLADRDDAD